ncbi:MAG: 50S ribosomal protein L29 [Candidatus Omnitrophota bacterium]
MKASEIRNMTKAEIEQKIRSLKEQMFGVKAEFTSDRVERPHRLRQAKRDVARCHTILKEKENEERL